MKTLCTARLILRPWTLEDAPDMYDYARTPNVGPAAGWKPHESIEETQQVLRELFLPHDDNFAMQRKDDGRVIGSIGLHEDQSRPKGLPGAHARLRHERKGLGPGLHARGVHGRAGIRLCGARRGADDRLPLPLERALPPRHRAPGFRPEGLRRMAGRNYDGRIEDEMAYSMTRSEFFRGRG